MLSEATVFVDTNVLIYAEDRAHADKHRAARTWLRTLWLNHRGRLSNQVLNEFYANATRKLKPAMPAGDARAEVRRYQRWQPWAIDHATVESAWSIESRFGLAYMDALVVAAAKAQGCELLLSLELAHGLQLDSVQILNPLQAAPDALSGASKT